MPLRTFRVVEDGDIYVLMRVMKITANYNQVPALQADFATIKRAVWNEDSDATVLAQSTLTIASVMLNALSLGDIWTADKSGFNFIDKVPKTAVPSDATFSIEYEFTTSAGLGSVVRTEAVRVKADKLWSQ